MSKVKEKPHFSVSYISCHANPFSISKYTIEVTFNSSGKISSSTLNRILKHLQKLKIQ